ncbi:MAG: hypothetical protein ABF382_06170 [Akkermansiaceae bacterium]
MFIFEILATLSIISINVFNQCINKKAISIPAILSPMNPLAERVHFIASELTQLHATVKRLADTISGLKQEIMNEEVFKRPSPTSHLGLTPPPLPAQLPEPIEASELTPISAQPNLVLNGATSESVEEVEVTAPSPQNSKQSLPVSKCISDRFGLCALELFYSPRDLFSSVDTLTIPAFVTSVRDYASP